MATPAEITPTLNAGFRLDRRVWIALSLLTLYIIWSTTYLGIRFAIESFPPYLMLGIRFVTAGGVLFTVLRLNGRPMPTRKQWRNATLVGFIMMACGTGSVALAEQTVSSGLAATLSSTAPLWAMLISMFWRYAPARTEWIGVALGIGGVLMLSLESNLQANPLGMALVLFSTISWAGGSVLSQHLDMAEGTMLNATEMLCGGAVLLVLSLLRGERMEAAPTPTAVIALVYLITFGSLLALSAYTYLLKMVSPTLATSYAFVNPAIALLLGAALAGEHVSTSTLLALPVILLGVAFVALKPRVVQQSDPAA